MAWQEIMQGRLGVRPDGDVGRGTLTALFMKGGAKREWAEDYALAANVHFRRFGILDAPLRLAHFMGQCAHESGGFRYVKEIWGPTAQQQTYQGRMGNVNPGDGELFMGRGPGMLTGRDNYRDYGRKIGINLEARPELVELPSIGLLVFCAFWDSARLNGYADRDEVKAVSNGINRGNPAAAADPIGFADRKVQTAKFKALIL
jgi:putative chitinase